LNLFKILLL